MRWFDSYLNRAAPTWMSDAGYARVTLPRLTRPNLVARLYMLFAALSTGAIAWWVPRSTISRIVETGGIAPHLIIGVMMAATVLGFLDIFANDCLLLQDRFSQWLESRRMQRCFVIGGCYLVLTYAGSGSHVTGTGWLLAYWLQMTFCSGLLAWSLRALTSATVAGGRNAQA